MPLILICVVIFGAWFSYQYKHNLSKGDHASEDFWKKEQEANFTRRKSTDDIDFLTFSEDDLPPCPENADSEITLLYNELTELMQKPCADLSDLTNTELKLKYGAPNFEALSEADGNFIALVRKLTSYGIKLGNAGFVSELRKVYALACKIDAATADLTLAAAKSYVPEGNIGAIEEIIERAQAEERSLKLSEDLRNILSECINGYSTDAQDNVSDEITHILNELESR